MMVFLWLKSKISQQPSAGISDNFSWTKPQEKSRVPLAKDGFKVDIYDGSGKDQTILIILKENFLSPQRFRHQRP